MNIVHNTCRKIASGLEYLIGISLTICLFAGGIGFVGYMVALWIGGDLATEFCIWIYNTYYGVLIKLATYTTLATFLLIYLKGDAKWENPIKYWSNEIRNR